jgi:hypothetical protein
MKRPIGGHRVAAAVATSVLVLAGTACGGRANPNATGTTAATGPSTISTGPVSTGPLTGPHAKHAKRLQPRPKKGHVKHVKLKGVKQRARHKAALAVHLPPRCPLTGTRPPGGHVPKRAALAVKIENLPEARPQWGLDQADIVFEEPVEGGITRFIAVYQCHDAPRIEPVRSARLVDPQILEPLGRMLMAYSGAIQPAINEIDARRSLLFDVGADRVGSAYWRDPTRYAPHNLVTSTAALYAAAAALHDKEKGPTPIFSYGHEAKGGTPAAAVSIYDPLDTTTWTWRRATGIYYRSYSDTGAAMQGDNVQITASNIIVMLVHEHPTPWPEDITGALEQELTLKGHGPAWVLRDGAVFFGHWERPFLDDPTVFYETNGTKVPLTAGNTWIELVPDGLRVSVEP